MKKSFLKVLLGIVAMNGLLMAEQTYTYVNVPVLYSEPVYDNRQTNNTYQVKVPCQGQGQQSGDSGLMKLDLGTAIGAVGGVVLGNQVGNGNGKTAAKVVGGVLGGVGANRLTSSMGNNSNGGECYETRSNGNNNYSGGRIKGYNNTFEINGQNYVKFTPNQVREIQIKITYSF